MSPRTAITVLVALVVLFLCVASPADAQRRRRRRQPPPPPPTEQADAGVAPSEGTTSGSAPEGATPAPPGQHVDGDAAEDGRGVGSEPAEGAQAEGSDSPSEPQAPPPSEDDLSLGPDISPIRSEFTAIMDELVQLRSRTAVLGQQLFHTRVRVTVQNRAADDNALQRIALTLDGAPIFQANAGELDAEDGRQVFDGFAAPGPHVIGVEAEQHQRANDDFRYTMRDTYRFQVVRDRLTEILIILDDDSDIGEDFEDDGEGEFDVQTRFRVATRELER